MNAEAVSLGRLLDLLDRVAGTSSTVPPELQNRNVSVQFTDLALGQSIKKIFEGLPIDYALLEGSRLIVSALSADVDRVSSGVQAPAPTRSAATPQPSNRSAPVTNPFQAPGNRPAAAAARAAGAGGGVQPAVIQTPFGPLVNPRAAQGGAGQPGSPLAMPGQGGLPFAVTGTPPGSQSGGDAEVYVTNPAMLEMMLQQQQQQQQPNSPPNLLGNTKPPVFENTDPAAPTKGPNPPKPGP